MSRRPPSLLLLLLPALALPALALAACQTVERAGSPAVPAQSPATSAATCPPAWLAAPDVAPSLAVPDGGGGVLLHGAATGAQVYACQSTADGGTTWNLTGPRAELRDCAGSVVARHFASDGGAAAPEWQSPDGAYVVAHKVAAVTPDGGAGAVPWLLLEANGHGGAGTLARVEYVQRVNTDGGVAPGGPCQAGATRDVPYAADYYFYGPQR